MLVDLFGDYPQVRVLDFLIENRDYDYSLSDIARESNVARPTLYSMVDGLMELGVVRETRRTGNARMFGINKKSPIVKSLAKFDFELSKKLIRKELARQEAEAESERISILVRDGKIDQAIQELKKIRES